MIAIERARKLWDGPRSTWITLCIVLSCQLVCALVLAVISAMDDIKIGQTFGDHWAVYVVHMIISVFAMFLFANKSKTHGLAVSHLFSSGSFPSHAAHTHSSSPFISRCSCSRQLRRGCSCSSHKRDKGTANDTVDRDQNVNQKQLKVAQGQRQGSSFHSVSISSH